MTGTQDPADQLAARLACGGDPLPVHIEENETNYTIGWQGSYRLDGDTFVYEGNQSRRLTAIRGYPVKISGKLIVDSRRSGAPRIPEIFG